MTGVEEPVQVRRAEHRWDLTIARPAARNSLNAAVIDGLQRAWDQAESDGTCRLVVIGGQPGVFCTGMDLEASTANDGGGDASSYMALLKRFSSSKLVSIAKVDGMVMAGGVGLAAACDLIFATPRTTFALSEALWGLLPAMVTPFLIRRVGFQKAYAMTLTTNTVDAKVAAHIGLVDEVTDDLERTIRRHGQRLRRLDSRTVSDMKNYFRRMWIINDEMEQTAVKEIERLSAEPRIRENIRNYVELGRLPWEKW